MTRPLGAALYDILPAVYRLRDEPPSRADGAGPGDLRAFLDGAGDLLDAVYRTLQQRHADNFPDRPDDAAGLACQDWLLPYFAELVDARLFAPTPDRQRDEIAQAVRWRQGKGTRAVLESVFESLDQSEAVLQEGFRRVATTPSVAMQGTCMPLQPATSLGYAREPLAGNPSSMARHPALPAVTPDVRCVSRAIAADVSNAGAQALRIDGARVLYRQASAHGAPCFPGSFEDVSLRTPDMRDPDWRVGHHHPRTVVAYLPPPSGFFPANAPGVNWTAEPGARVRELIDVFDDDGCTVYRNRTLGTRAFVPVRVRRRVELGEPPGYVGPADTKRWRFEGIAFESSVEVFEGRATFLYCAARALVSHAVDARVPTLVANDCLLGRLQNARGLSRLVHCTVLGDCLTETLEASDCIFEGIVREDHPDADPPERGCIRFSRIQPAQQAGGLALHRVTRDRVYMLHRQYGQPGCAVLHPACSTAVTRGAEDEGELGAFHHRQHLRALAAVAEKTRDFLPVGMRVAITYDGRLAEPLPPPASDR